MEVSINQEETFNLIRYRLPDPQADVELEVKDYLAFHESSKEVKFDTFRDRPTEFYAQSKAFFVELLGEHLKLRHLLFRTGLLVGLAKQIQATTYADWGAGSGRDCIAMARSGLQVTHYDILGEGTRLAAWRYQVRGLNVQIADATNPPEAQYHMISNFDCLEHVEDPVWVLGQIISRLKPGGFLFLAVDFYNFDLNATGPHLPKNFVYGGILQMVLEKLGFQKIYGADNVWKDTALAYLMVWQKPVHWDKDRLLLRTLYKETYELLSRFRGFYEQEMSQIDKKLLASLV